ncbi:MAG: glycosyltransferase [Solirubrobacterales bacterium]
MAAGVEPGSEGTVVFFPEGAFGPTNNCIGIADVMRRRGWRVVFIAEESFAGTFTEKGFEERLMRLGPAPEQEEDAGQFWKDYIRDTAPVFRKPTIEQLEGFIVPTFEALVEGARYVDERLTEIIEEVRPDVIVEDNVVSFPALPASGVPWVRIVSCNPAEVKDRDVPPTFSGYPVADRGRWDEFRAEYARVIRPLYESFNEFCRERGAPPLPPLELMHDSPDLDLWLYPAAVDYARFEPLAGIWHNLESCVRSTDEPWALPEELATGEMAERPLVYLSLGSLGSGDVELMRKLISELADAPYRVVVSMGPQHAELELAPNMTGAEFLPQVSLLPEVDLIVTHGGNNTVTEGLHFGKPMVVLPLFWDQYDNAQRIDETGFGRRLDTYGHEGPELIGAIDGLLADEALAKRLEKVSSHLRGVRGTERAAELIATLG